MEGIRWKGVVVWKVERSCGMEGGKYLMAWIKRTKAYCMEGEVDKS